MKTIMIQKSIIQQGDRKKKSVVTHFMESELYGAISQKSEIKQLDFSESNYTLATSEK